MTLQLTLIDEFIREQHHYLEPDDLCYFFGEYTARQNAAYSETNQLILNLKKSNERRAYADYRYKTQAISRVAQMITDGIGDPADFTFVPVPPSKCISDSGYDDRMTAVLRICKEMNPSVDYRELVVQNDSMTASHLTAHRPSPDEIAANYRMNTGLLEGCRRNILIFDDVLTAGSHFKAMKSFLMQRLPDSRIAGLFVARTTREADLASLLE